MTKDNLKHETANSTNMVLAEVAVLSAYRKRFDMWVRENAKEGEKYICVMRLQDTMGRVFTRVEKTFEWWRMEEPTIVEEAVMMRCR